MKSTVLAIILFMAVSIKTTAQFAFADPATTQMAIQNMGGATLNANDLQVNGIMQLKIPLFNNSQETVVPIGGIQVKIGLGSRMVVDPSFVIANAPLNNYFSWSWVDNGGQIQIVGILINPLPVDFIGTAVFRVKPTILGTSTITTNVLITNDNAPPILSDLDPNNNIAQLQYTVVLLSSGPVPVTFTKLNLLKKGCSINVNFLIENEINVDHYEIESSRDGNHFVKVGTVAAANRFSYLKDFALTQDVRSATLFVRVKAVDLDGSFKYSEIKTISGLCEDALQYNISPNPVKAQNLVLYATTGLFNGRYKLMVLDMTGRLLQTKEVEINNSIQINYELGVMAPGKYILKVINLDGSDKRALPFEKF